MDAMSRAADTAHTKYEFYAARMHMSQIMCFQRQPGELLHQAPRPDGEGMDVWRADSADDRHIPGPGEQRQPYPACAEEITDNHPRAREHGGNHLAGMTRVNLMSIYHDPSWMRGAPRRDSAGRQLEQLWKTSPCATNAVSFPSPWNRCCGSDDPRELGGQAVAVTQAPMQQLELVKEAKIFDILAGRLDPRLEASGVLVKDGQFYVIFDNLPDIARMGPELSPVAAANHVIKQHKGRRSGFGDIAYDSRQGRFYILIESLPRGHGTYMANVQEYDASFSYLGQAWLDFPLDRPNKGLEGLTCVQRGGQTYLLGLCEGNRCRGGADGRLPGGGRVHVFQRGDKQWEHLAKIRLPETVLFEDYSGIAVTGDRIVVISQVSSALWLGNLAPSGWEVTGAGICYALPRGADGGIIYRTAEGVSWIAPDQVVVVSDKAKPGQDPRCRAKDQSIHIFRIPTPASP